MKHFKQISMPIKADGHGDDNDKAGKIENPLGELLPDKNDN